MLPQEAADNPDYQYPGLFSPEPQRFHHLSIQVLPPIVPGAAVLQNNSFFHHSFKVYDFFGQWNKRPLWNDPISPLEDLSIIESTITFRKKIIRNRIVTPTVFHKTDTDTTMFYSRTCSCLNWLICIFIYKCTLKSFCRSVIIIIST